MGGIEYPLVKQGKVNTLALRIASHLLCWRCCADFPHSRSCFFSNLHSTPGVILTTWGYHATLTLCHSRLHTEQQCNVITETNLADFGDHTKVDSCVGHLNEIGGNRTYDFEYIYACIGYKKTNDPRIIETFIRCQSIIILWLYPFVIAHQWKTTWKI